MASCQTSRWQTSSPYVRLTVTESASTGASATLAWTLEYYSVDGANTSVKKNYSAVVGGETVASGSYDIKGKEGWNTIASGTKVITKTASKQTIAFSLSFSFNMSWNSVYCGTKTASGSISVAAETTYTVAYNANGGTGAPGTQTKWAGVTLTLSNTKPTRTGYTFQNWLSSAQNKTYAPGAFYGYDASTTMTAQWSAVTYTVSYNANGGSGAPGNQTKTYGTALTLSSTKPTRANYNFKGWGTSASSTTVAYAPGASYTANAGITLYAIWELAYVKPRITGFSVSRCNSSGAISDSGTYALVKFSWACDKTVSGITIAWSGGSSGSATVSASGTSGTVSQVVGGGGLSADYTYTITATVTDSGGSTSQSSSMAGTAYVMDFLSGGKGVAFGKPAEKEGLDIGFHVHLNGNTLSDFVEDPAVYSVNTSGGSEAVLQSVYAEMPDTTQKNIQLNINVGGDTLSGGTWFVTLYKTTDDYGIIFARSYWGSFWLRTITYGTWNEWGSLVQRSSLLNAIYPVNSIYIGYSHTSPASLFGGTWTRIESRFLWATPSSGTIGATAGEQTTTLTEAQLPNIKGTMHFRSASNGNNIAGVRDGTCFTYTNDGGDSWANSLSAVASEKVADTIKFEIGSNAAHNNMPPYVNVAIWRRTA
jgi:uncharacterized repeat protein (TIGR02543 family)